MVGRQQPVSLAYNTAYVVPRVRQAVQFCTVHISMIDY